VRLRHNLRQLSIYSDRCGIDHGVRSIANGEKLQSDVIYLGQRRARKRRTQSNALFMRLSVRRAPDGVKGCPWHCVYRVSDRRDDTIRLRRSPARTATFTYWPTVNHPSSRSQHRQNDAPGPTFAFQGRPDGSAPGRPIQSEGHVSQTHFVILYSIVLLCFYSDRNNIGQCRGGLPYRHISNTYRQHCAQRKPPVFNLLR